MSWSASASGEFHEVVKKLRNLQVDGDQKAIELAKEMALCAIDTQKAPNVIFSVSLYGHSGTEDSYNTGANVSVSRKS